MQHVILIILKSHGSIVRNYAKLTRAQMLLLLIFKSLGLHAGSCGYCLPRLTAASAVSMLPRLEDWCLGA